MTHSSLRKKLQVKWGNAAHIYGLLDNYDT